MDITIAVIRTIAATMDQITAAPARRAAAQGSAEVQRRAAAQRSVEVQRRAAVQRRAVARGSAEAQRRAAARGSAAMPSLQRNASKQSLPC